MHIAKWLAKSSNAAAELCDAAQPYVKSMTCARAGAGRRELIDVFAPNGKLFGGVDTHLDAPARAATVAWIDA